ncbi:uncharacterized protein NPIL_186611 [Nephila pilipes]|uniref:C2H2-type domain-containing protein n=1 Tax=Nephila pilipes TaxID=299642 RepID=A0A8X6I5W5_NEPPI|nr:uncharacterized protein NPIL_186611 [Nephila pilipes]
MDKLEQIFNEIDIPIDGNVLAEMDYGDISNTQWNEPFETINEIDFACPECKKLFSLKKNLIRHVKSSHSATSFICPACRITFKRMDNLKRHHLKAHGQPFVKTAASTSSSESGRMSHPEKENAAPTTSFICPVCDKNCSTIHGLIRHLKIHASYGKDDAAPSTSNENNTEVRKIPLLKSSAVIQSAFKSRIKTLRLENSDNFLEIKQFLNSKEQDFQDIILNELQKNELKVNCMLMCKYSKASNTGIVTEEKNFKTKNNIILTQTNIGEFYYSIVDKLLAETADFQEKESGWSLHSILYLEIRVNKFNPLHASSFIELPDIIKKKHAVINIQNDDNLFLNGPYYPHYSR